MFHALNQNLVHNEEQFEKIVTGMARAMKQ